MSNTVIVGNGGTVSVGFGGQLVGAAVLSGGTLIAGPAPRSDSRR